MERIALINLFEKPISGEWGREPSEEDNNTVGVIRTTNFSKDIRIKADSEIVKRLIDDKKVDKKKLIAGDIIIEKSGGSPTQPVGRILYYDVTTDVNLCNNFTSVLRPKKGNDNKFLAYLMNSLYEKGEVLKYQNKTTGIINLKLDRYLAATKVSLPPLQTQKKIVEVLDKAQELIDLRKKQIELLDELIQSVFYDMFGDPVTNPKGWEVKKLDDIAIVRSSKRVFVDELVETGIPFYRGTEIGALSIGDNVIPKHFITKDHYDKLREITGVPKIGDLLMPSICSDGRIWRVDSEDPFYFKDGRVLWIQINSGNIDSVYLQYYLREKFINDYHNIASGTTFAELKIFALKGVDVLVPNNEFQEKFKKIVNGINKNKALMKQSLIEMENNFKSLIQRAFKGELFN